MLIHTLIGCWLLCELLASSNVTINFIATCRIFYLSQLAKYLPGVVWGFAMQASMLDSHNAMKKIVYANIRLMLFITGFFFFCSLAFLAFEHSIFVAIGFFVCACVTVSMIRNVPFFALLPSFIQKLVSRLVDEDRRVMDIPTPTILGMCIGLFITYLASISSMILAFYDFSLGQSIELAVYQCLSWIVGVLAFVVPAGMGIREAVFLMLGIVTENFTADQIQSIAIITRTIQTFQDLLFSLGALALVKMKLI